MADPVTEDAPNGVTGGVPFKNSKGGLSVTLLRLKQGEDLDSAITRLSAEGWILPSKDKLELGKDATSAFIRIKE